MAMLRAAPILNELADALWLGLKRFAEDMDLIGDALDEREVEDEQDDEEEAKDVEKKARLREEQRERRRAERKEEKANAATKLQAGARGWHARRRGGAASPGQGVISVVTAARTPLSSPARQGGGEKGASGDEDGGGGGGDTGGEGDEARPGDGHAGAKRKLFGHKQQQQEEEKASAGAPAANKEAREAKEGAEGPESTDDDDDDDEDEDAWEWPMDLENTDWQDHNTYRRAERIERRRALRLAPPHIFHHSLREVVGTPGTDGVAAMAREHTLAADSLTTFCAAQHQVLTTSQLEWYAASASSYTNGSPSPPLTQSAPQLPHHIE